MRLRIKKRPRKFKVGLNETVLKDFGKIYLKDKEQITFCDKNSEYDVVKTNWGYYATPSINFRLKKFKLRTFLIKNYINRKYIVIVRNNKMKEFKKYLKTDKYKIIKEFTNI